MTFYAFMGALEQGFAYGFLVLGVYLTFRVLDFPDLTVDGSLPLGAAVSAVAISSGVDPWVSLLLALGAGFLAGMVTGILNTKFGILHLLASILTMIALYSINLRVMGAPNVTLLGKPTVLDPLLNAGLGPFVAAPLLFGVLSCLGLLGLLWLLHTAYGLAIQATGANRQMITSQGVNTDRVIILTVGLSNGLAALSGALLCQSQGAADVNMGIGTIVAGLASVIVGETLFGCRSVGRALLAALLGSAVYRLAIALALSLKLGSFSFTPSDLNLLTALLVVGALVLPQVRRKVLKR
ncbi:ABC transporter permease [Geothermobacter hydrogeniphilus]|uniref:ABC transporter permease n=1 Tax=Geothermobacter hydrogeniphilus TaxID=1969733 RepID=A0A1X0Y9Y1_9BACT|nr:ABC transporter permease [Geothermobacter hydrogeniphilus]ORJ62040.1 ABC transporter permease [Geothermobacter hydrogeniphilus]